MGGNDTLTGERMHGGPGNDSYFSRSSGDFFHEEADEGIDTVYFYDSTRPAWLGANLENLVLMGDCIGGSGNALDNRITGNSLDNYLQSDPGNDTIDGDAGTDKIFFGESKSAYDITVGSGSVTISGAEGTDVLIGFEQIAFADQLYIPNAHPATGSVTISGSATQGSLLGSSTSGIVDGDGRGSGALAYQWCRDGVAIEGASANKYLLVAADVQHTISLRVRFIDAAGNTETLWSVGTASVGTGDRVAPTIIGFAPADNAVSAAVTSNIVVTFDETIVRGGGDLVLQTADGTTIESFNVAASSRIALNGSTLTIDPTANLPYGTEFELRFTNGNVRDSAGNGLVDASSYNFSTAAKMIDGTGGADALAGLADVEVIMGLGGNDTITGAAGNDTVDGGPGLDTAVLNVSGLLDYDLNGTVLKIVTEHGSSTLVNIERVRLTDTLLVFDTQPGSAPWQAAALLWAALGGAPQDALFSQWVREADATGGLPQLAQKLIDRYAPEIDSQALVAHLYRSVLGVSATPGQIEDFAGRIGTGKTWVTNADFLAFAAGHGVNTERMADFVGSCLQLDLAYFV